MIRLIAVSLLLVLTNTFAFAQSENPKPEINDFTLENGLRLIVIPDRRAPVVTHMVWYKVGAADDPVGTSGIAHFFEHLMFKGTSTYPGSEFSDYVSSIGGQENAFTSYDYTSYYQRVAPSSLPTVMKYEADRMRNLVLSDEQILPERDVILEERSSRVDSSPGSIMSEFVSSALYVHHPYGRPVIGFEHEIAKLDRVPLTAFYEKWYQPWNAIVVVSGDVDAKEVLQHTKDSYGKIVATSKPTQRTWTQDPTPVVAKEISYKDKRVTSPSWSRRFIAPSERTAQKSEAEALELLSSVLGGSVTSRIHKEVVLEKKLATSAGAYYSGSSLGNGSFGLYASPRGEAKMEDVIAAVEAEVDKLLRDGITQEELDKARASYIRDTIYAQDSQVAMARIFGALLSIGGSVDEFTTFQDKLNAVTVNDVNKAARKYLNRDVSVTSYLLPEEKS